jgi:hypothetical protein
LDGIALFARNTALIRITVDLIFGDPYRLSGRNRHTSPQLDQIVVADMRRDGPLKVAAACMGQKFLNDAQALIHGGILWRPITRLALAREASCRSNVVMWTPESGYCVRVSKLSMQIRYSRVIWRKVWRWQVSLTRLWRSSMKPSPTASALGNRSIQRKYCASRAASVRG